MNEAAQRVTLPSGFVFDRAAAAAHVMQPRTHTGVISSRGLEEGTTKFAPREKPAGVTLSFNTDGFVAALNAALANSTSGYVMQLRQHGQPIASAQVNWAKQPSDGSESWAQTVRMHIASCSKLITAIAMTRTLAAQNLPPSTKIIDYLPTYWAKGPNIDKITFAQLMTHTSGFRVTGSDTFYPIMKAQVAAGVTDANLGQYSYQNMNFSLCRILLPVMNGTIPANTTFPPATEDQDWDYATITAYADYVAQYLFQPAGVSGPTLTHPSPDALAYNFPPGAGWNSGDLTADSGGTSWHMSVDDLLDVMGCFRRQGTIMSPAAAQTMLDNGFGIDLIEFDEPRHALQQERPLAVRRRPDGAEPRLLPAARHGAGRARQFPDRQPRPVLPRRRHQHLPGQHHAGDPGRRLDRPSRPHRRAIPGSVQRLRRQPRHAVDGRQRLWHRGTALCGTLGQNRLAAGLAGPPRPDRGGLSNHLRPAHRAGLPPCARQRLCDRRRPTLCLHLPARRDRPVGQPATA